MAKFDTIIRRGKIFDGNGGLPYVADIAVKDGVIAEIGPDLSGDATEEINADGLIVTPGFIDGHTHYDAQVIWDSSIEPSSSHGVTTVVMSNCGVGFAPVHSSDHDRLIAMMEDVEDIPGTALHEGISWEWETFPQYLEAVAKREYAVDVAAQIPHAPLRLYVMGDRAEADEPATGDDIVKMSQMIREALAAGAIGFSTSRVLEHRSLAGVCIPGTFAAEDELYALANAVRSEGRGIFQAVPRGTVGAISIAASANQLTSEVQMLGRIAVDAQVPILWSLHQAHDEPEKWREALATTRQVNETGGRMRAMAGPRAPGQLSGWAGFHMFMRRPSFIRLEELPFDQMIAELRKPEVKAAILAEPDLPADNNGMLSNYPKALQSMLDKQYIWDSSMEFEPDFSQASLAALAAAAGDDPASFAYDAMLRDNGYAQLAAITLNYAEGNFDALAELHEHPDTVIGLSDAGAHVRIICDAANPTFSLIFWSRDRKRGKRFSVAELVKKQTADMADTFGFADRGRLKVGLRADINVIDFDNLALELPRIEADLPKGGKRLRQGARGYVATLVKGTITRRNDRDTGARPGRLVRDGGKHENIPATAVSRQPAQDRTPASTSKQTHEVHH